MRARQGSVLMETVIAIPIFLVVIAGTLWLGDLSFKRNQSLVSDRYVAWNKGNRHGGASATEADVMDRFFGYDPHTRIKNIRVKNKVLDWYQEVEATVKTKITMPDGIRGMFSSGTTWDMKHFEDKQTVTGRDGPHLVVMRIGSRDESMDQVDWKEVKKEKWWPSLGKGGKGGKGGKRGKGGKSSSAITPLYDRYGKFVGWSN